MSETFQLAAKKREKAKKSARHARANKQIPGVVYGADFETASVAVDYSEFLKLFRKAGQSSLIDLDIEGKAVKVLVHDYALDPVMDTFDHVDFHVINMKEATTVHVPLVFVGESNAMKNLGGLLSKNHEALDIRCLPTDIPHDIEVDISALNDVTDTISIADLKLSDKLEVMQYEPEEVVASITSSSAGNAGEEEPVTEVAGEEGSEAEGEAAAE